MRRSIGVVGTRAMVLLLGGSLLSCIDGPFAVVNPHDSAMKLTMTIVGGPDTLRAMGEETLFQLVTDPPLRGYTVQWLSSDPIYLGSLGDGRFVVNALPTIPRTFAVSAALGLRIRYANVVILPP